MHYENVKSQDAIALSPNPAQSSALVEAKRFQIVTEHLVNMNSTSSHYKQGHKQLPYEKMYSSKTIKNNICYTLLSNRRTQFQSIYFPNHIASNAKGFVKIPNVVEYIEKAGLQESDYRFKLC